MAKKGFNIGDLVLVEELIPGASGQHFRTVWLKGKVTGYLGKMDRYDGRVEGEIPRDYYEVTVTGRNPRSQAGPGAIIRTFEEEIRDRG